MPMTLVGKFRDEVVCALTRLGAVVRGQAQMLAADLAPAMAAVADAAANAGTGASEFGRHLQDIDRDVRAVTAAIREFLQVLGILGRTVPENLTKRLSEAQDRVTSLNRMLEVEEGMLRHLNAIGVEANEAQLEASANLRRSMEAAKHEIMAAGLALARFGDLQSRIANAPAAPPPADPPITPPPGTGGGGGGLRQVGTEALGAQQHLQGLVEEARRLHETELAEAARAAERMGDSLANAFVDGVTGVRSFKDALSGMLDDIGRQLLSSGLQSVFKGMNLGSIFAGIPGLAGGGMIRTGGLAVVGEQGRELVNLPRGAQVIPNHEMDNLGGTTRVEVVLGPDLVASVLDQAAGQSVQIFKASQDGFSDRVARANAKPWRR